VAVFGFVASSAIVAIGAIITALRYFKFSFGVQILGTMLLKFKFSLARRI
jgi:hypothetical protein